MGPVLFFYLGFFYLGFFSWLCFVAGEIVDEKINEGKLVY